MTDVFDIGEEGSADLKLTEVSEDTIELTQGRGRHKIQTLIETLIQRFEPQF